MEKSHFKRHELTFRLLAWYCTHDPSKIGWLIRQKKSSWRFKCDFCILGRYTKFCIPPCVCKRVLCIQKSSWNFVYKRVGGVSSAISAFLGGIQNVHQLVVVQMKCLECPDIFTCVWCVCVCERERECVRVYTYIRIFECMNASTLDASVSVCVGIYVYNIYIYIIYIYIYIYVKYI